MNELIKVQHNDDGNIIVSGRELHEFLELRSQYTNWIDRMIEQGDFEENVDYVLVKQKYLTNNPKNPNSTRIDHALTMDMAKHIAMLQRNTKGKQARQYFIEVEKKFKHGVQEVVEQPDATDQLTTADRIKMMELIANTPQHAIDAVSALAKPFMTEDKPERSTIKPLEELKEPKPSKKKNASSAGHTIPFNAKRLRNHLIRNNISQSELVRMSGVASGVISAAITERQRPGLENRGKICVALGKPVDWLNGGVK